MTEDGDLPRARPEGTGRSAWGTGGRPGLGTTFLAVVAVILTGWALRAAAVVAVPLVASVLIALAVMPVRDRVRDRVPRRLGWLGTTAAMALILVVLCLFFAGLWLVAQQVLSELPARPEQIVEVTQGSGGAEEQATLAEGAAAGAAAAETGTAAEQVAAEGGEGQGGILPGSVSGVVRMFGDRVAGAAGGVAVTILNSALTTVAGLAIIFFLTLLILAESDRWRDKLRTVAHPRDQWRLTESVGVIAGKVRVHLGLRTVLGLATAALYAIWLWFFGVGLILTWALLTFLLNFVPVVGSLIAGLLPVVYALVTQGWGTALAVGLGLLVIEQVMGSYVAPKVEGDHIALSPLVVLVSLLFWSWVWGIPGALLSIPVTAALAVLGAHVPTLRPWALLLTDRTTMRGLDHVTRPD